MINRKNISKLSYLLPFGVSTQALAHHEHTSSHHYLLGYLAVGLTSAAMLGTAYFILVMLGKTNIKKNKGITQ